MAEVNLTGIAISRLRMGSDKRKRDVLFPVVWLAA